MASTVRDLLRMTNMPFHPKKVLPLLEGKEMEGGVYCIFGTKLAYSGPCNTTHVTQGFPDI